MIETTRSARNRHGYSTKATNKDASVCLWLRDNFRSGRAAQQITGTFQSSVAIPASNNFRHLQAQANLAGTPAINGFLILWSCYFCEFKAKLSGKPSILGGHLPKRRIQLANARPQEVNWPCLHWRLLLSGCTVRSTGDTG